MCVPQLLPLVGLGGATAAGATAGAATAASALSTIGTIVSVGGSIYQGIQARNAAKEQAAVIEQQKVHEAQLNSTKDQRERAKFRSAIAQQSAELAARNVQLDSATAVYLGQTAAREMAFSSQSIQSTGQARQSELSAGQRSVLARGRQAMFKGGLSAAGVLLNRAPDLWPELLA